MVVYAVSNSKGGVTKTTTTRTLIVGVYLALKRRGRTPHVCAIDLDQQGHLTKLFLIDLEGRKHMYHLLADSAVTIEDDILLKHQDLEMYIGPTNQDLAAIGLVLNAVDHHDRLKEKLAPILDLMDYIIIDTGPSLDVVVINVLALAHKIIIPTQTQLLSLDSTDMMLRIVARVQQSYNPGLQVAGILPTLHDVRSNHERSMVDQIYTRYAGYKIYPVIPRRNSVVEAVPSGLSILEAKASSDIARIYQHISEDMVNTDIQEGLL
jgi:chromosome partitioning protein